MRATASMLVKPQGPIPDRGCSAGACSCAKASRAKLLVGFAPVAFSGVVLIGAATPRTGVAPSLGAPLLCLLDGPVLYAGGVVRGRSRRFAARVSPG